MASGILINGKVLAELRCLRLMSQEQLAFACRELTSGGADIAREEISAYERERVRPSAHNLRAIVHVLQLSPAELRALVRTPELDTVGNASQVEGHATDRREFSELVGLLISANLPAPGIFGGALERIAADTPVEASLIEAHTDLANVFARLYPKVRPDVLAAPVAHQARAVLSLLDRPSSETEQRRLHGLAVGLYDQAGLLAFHMGDRVAARQYFAVARDVAFDSGQQALCAQALGVTSILASSIPRSGEGGDTSRALALLQAAVERARSADVHTRGWLLRWLAMESAASGDEHGFRNCMEQANRCVQPSTEAGFFGKPGPFGASQAETASTLGGGLLLLRNAFESITALDESLLLRPTQWRSRRIVPLVDKAVAYVLLQESEQACSLLTEALDLTLTAGYRAGLDRIRGARARFPKPWAQQTCVLELDERLQLT